jgi:hypothetical protein
MMDVNDQTVLRRSDRTTFEVAGDEAIVIDLDSGTYFSLNEVGTVFWRRLDGRQTLRQHAEAIASDYDVDVSVVVADLAELAARLRSDRLVDVG